MFTGSFHLHRGEKSKQGALVWLEQVEFPGRAFQTDEMAQVKTWEFERPSDLILV